MQCFFSCVNYKSMYFPSWQMMQNHKKKAKNYKMRDEYL